MVTEFRNLEAKKKRKSGDCKPSGINENRGTKNNAEGRSTGFQYQMNKFTLKFPYKSQKPNSAKMIDHPSSEDT